MLLFQIVCLIISTGFFRCMSIFDIFPLGINYIGFDESNEIIVAADKTNNMYKMSYENYDKLLSENITQKYKKEKHQTAASIVNECKSIEKNCISKID